MMNCNQTSDCILTTVGYGNPAQFNQNYRPHFHCSPTEEAKWMQRHLGAPV